MCNVAGEPSFKFGKYIEQNFTLVDFNFALVDIIDPIRSRRFFLLPLTVRVQMKT